MKNLPLQTGGAARASSMNHHLGLQTQTWEEAEHKDRHSTPHGAGKSISRVYGITIYSYKA